MARKEDRKPYIDEAMPELICLFKNKEDAHNTLGSNKKVPFICPCCGKEVICQIDSVTRAGHVICSTCSDGFSYPEKMFSNILTQLDIKFVHHYCPEWAKPYIYDFKFTVHKHEYIVEMDGDIGHGKVTIDKRKSGEESLAIDNLKDELASEHGIEVIRIDCRYKDGRANERQAYIRRNIESSKLSSLLDLSCIDWKECNIRGCGSKFREVTLIYNSGTKFVDRIAERVGISSRCVIKYLREAMHLGIINTDKIFLNEETMNKTIYGSRSEKIYCYEDAKVFPSILETTLHYGISRMQMVYAFKKNNGAVVSIQKTFAKYNDLPKDFEFKPRPFDEKVQTRNRWIYQWDEDGNLIEIYKKQSDLPEQYSPASINKCCNGERKRAYGFKWSYVNLENQA